MYKMSEKQKPVLLHSILRCSITLLIIIAVVAASLMSLDMLTGGIIKQNQDKALERALIEVMPKAVSFVPLSDAVCMEQGAKSIYEAKSGPDVIGYCIELVQPGYSGDIDIVIGVGTSNMMVTDIRIISMSEMAGLGVNVTSDKFISQFKGMRYDSDRPFTVTKANAPGVQVNAVSGATVSSKAVTAAVNKAMGAASALWKARNGALPERPDGGMEPQFGEANLSESNLPEGGFNNGRFNKDGLGGNGFVIGADANDKDGGQYDYENGYYSYDDDDTTYNEGSDDDE